jgi:hypothetical protein
MGDFFWVIGLINESLVFENNMFMNWIRFLNFPKIHKFNPAGIVRRRIFFKKISCKFLIFKDFLKCFFSFSIFKKIEGLTVNKTPVYFLKRVRYKYFFLKVMNRSSESIGLLKKLAYIRSCAISLKIGSKWSNQVTKNVSFNKEDFFIKI